MKCSNPRCITSSETNLDQIFYLADASHHTYRCKYCDEKSEMIITSSENQVYNKTMPQALNACGIVLLYINSHMYNVKRRPSPMHVAAPLTDTECIILINNSLHAIQSSSLMLTYRTYFRSSCTNYDVATVTAFPYLNFALLKYLLRFNIVKKCSVSLFMSLFSIAATPLNCSASSWKPSSSASLAI